MKLASFDIFDTTLIRKCGDAKNVFYLLANRLFPTNLEKRNSFILWRIKAEEEAKSYSKQKEVTLSDIYFCSSLQDYKEYTPQQLLETEKQIEKENLIANPEVKTLIERKRDNGYRICFISDMYFDSTFLKKILKENGCLLNNEKVYVSCEYNARKSNGKLFKLIKNKLSPQIWIHYGDNPTSDVKIPLKIGINAHQIKTSFNPVEQKIIKSIVKGQSNYELSILSGLERAARISFGNDAFITFAANYVTPAYLPYIHFVMESARKQKTQCLYFLSRDGYILFKAAESIHSLYPEIKLKYLFISRKSLLLPYLKDKNTRDYLKVQDHQTIVGYKITSLLEGLGTSIKELCDKYNITFKHKKINSLKEQEEFLRKIFGTDSTFAPILKKRIIQSHKLLLSYFKQEGLLKNNRIGMVDVGWLGTTRLMINSILTSEGYSPVDLFFYYGIRNDVLPIKYGNYISFYRPEQLSTELTSLIENYFSASPYPTTIEYQNVKGNIEPLFPHNEVFKETKITKSNTITIQWIAREIIKMKINFHPAYWEWTYSSIKGIMTLKVNLSPLCFTPNFDKQNFVRKLSPLEILNIIVFGGRATAYDRASVQITCGRILTKILWPIHNLSSKWRRYLYLKTHK